jgi:zinc protease
MVVGDFDMDKVESEIRDRFEGLAARNETTPRAELALAPVGTPAATVYLDPDATTGDVELTLPHEVLFDGSIASARHDTLISLAFDMIATRLTDDVSRGVAPFTSAGVGNNGYVRRLDAPSISVSGDPAQLSASLDAVITEFERVRRFGFDTSEFKRVLRSYTAGLQAEFDGSTTNGDSDYIAQYVDHFLVGYAIPDADTSFQIYSAMYETITPEEVGTAFNELFATAAPHAMLVAPDSLTDTPTDADVVALLAALPTLDIAAREAAADGATELMAPPDPVQETASEQLPSDDALIAPTMLTFDNGARVVLNPTDIADNDIYLSATSPGGLSLVADADVTEAQAAVSVVTSGGVGDLDAVALDTLLSDAAIQLYPSIDQTSEGFTGASTTDDLELLFQLVNQYISKPRFDQVALDSTVSYLQTYVDDPNSDPDLAGFIAYTAARYGPEPRFAVLPTADELAGLDLTTIEKVWRERFSNPSDWVFAISGDFTLEDATDLARRYIGTLAGTGVTEQFKDFQQDPPEGIVTKDVRAGTGDKGTLDLEWSVASTDSRAENVNADVLTSILNIRLTDHIREKLGASYSPSASVSTFSEPDQLVETSMFVTGDPSTLPEISKIVIDDIADMQTSGPTSAEFDAAIAELRKSYDLFDNQTIGDLLAGAANTPAVLADFIDRRSRLADVTAESIKGFIGRAMPIDRYIEVRTVPT